MSTHLSAEQFVQYLGGGLPVEQLLAVDAHLVACQSCQDQLQITQRLATGVASLRADFSQATDDSFTHLTWEQMADLADQKLAAVALENAESHLQDCPACATELAELRHFAQHLTAFPAQEFVPPVPRSWLDKTLSFLGFANQPGNVFGWPMALKFAGAAALLLLIIWGGSRLWRGHNPTANAPEIAAHETPLPPLNPTMTPPPSASPDPARLALQVGGKEISLDAKGKVTGINFAAPADEKLASLALRTGRVELPAELKQLAASASGLMGQSSDETFRLLSPFGKIIATTRPRFTWQALSGATGYIVTLANPNTNFVLSSEPLTVPQWTPAKALPRGQTYTWQVTAVKEGNEIKAPLPDAPEARFRILTPSQFDEVARAEKAYAGNHLMLGLVYGQLGLMREAEAQFKALLAANPQSALARQLLQSSRVKPKT